MSSFSVTSSFSDATCLADRARSDAWRGALLAVIAALLIVSWLRMRRAEKAREEARRK